MSDQIPTVPFDTSKHVFKVRDRNTGREAYCDLQSVITAENVIEAEQAAPNVIDLSGYVSKEDLAEYQKSIDGEALAKAIAEHVPPPGLIAGHTSLIAELVKQVMELQAQGLRDRETIRALADGYDVVRANNEVLMQRFQT